MTAPFSFKILHRDGAARRGELSTAHGVVQTPAFMPVGTRAAVKSITQRDLEDLGAEIILGNTYHLYLKPGDGLIARCGGLQFSLMNKISAPARQWSFLDCRTLFRSSF